MALVLRNAHHDVEIVFSLSIIEVPVALRLLGFFLVPIYFSAEKEQGVPKTGNHSRSPLTEFHLESARTVAPAFLAPEARELCAVATLLVSIFPRALRVASGA